MIEEEVHEDAGHADVHPQRKRPSRYTAMLHNPHSQSVHHRENRERNDHDRKDRVRAEHPEIKRADRPRPGESRHDAVPQRVVRHVRHEKEQRRDARREHEPLVRLDPPSLDVDVAGE